MNVEVIIDDNDDIETKKQETNTLLTENKIMAQEITQQTPHHQIRINQPQIDNINKEKRKINKFTNLKRRLHLNIFINFLISIIVLILLFGIEWGVIPQRKLGYRCGDESISYPYNGDTITLTILLTGTYIGPLILFLIIETIREKSFKNIRLNIIWKYYKEILIGTNFILLITEFAKAIIGEHRPHFIDTCKPDLNINCINGQFIENYVCTNNLLSSWLIKDSSKSFPSGHSSLSVFSSLFCAYVVQSRLPSKSIGRIFKTFLMSICLLWGILCSLTRIADRRHHWWDVLCGVTLGILGVLFFVMNFHEKQKKYINKKSEKSISSTMLLDVTSKNSASARV